MSAINLLGRPRRRRKARKGANACRTAKGRVKKGWRLGKGGRCIRAKGRR